MTYSDVFQPESRISDANRAALGACGVSIGIRRPADVVGGVDALPRQSPRRGNYEAVGAGGDVLGPGAHVVEPVHRVGPSYGLRSDDFYAAHPRAPDCGPTRGLTPVAPSATPDLNLTFPTSLNPGDSIATGVGVPLDHPVAVCWCER